MAAAVPASVGAARTIGTPAGRWVGPGGRSAAADEPRYAAAAMLQQRPSHLCPTPGPPCVGHKERDAARQPSTQHPRHGAPRARAEEGAPLSALSVVGWPVRLVDREA
jgi:hypothetical protein